MLENECEVDRGGETEKGSVGARMKLRERKTRERVN